jgi:C-terminal processing protease CtpA/Prc
MRRSIFSLLGILLLASACQKMDPEDERTIRHYANIFAYNVMNTYYLWKDEVSDKISNWVTTEDPIKKVESTRYSMDHWTALYEDYTYFESAMTGSGKTFGMDFTFYYYDAAKTRLCAVVNYTYENSPARQAGLQRGDIIFTIDGEDLSLDNYQTLAAKFYLNSTIKLGMADGQTITLQAREMYENPVHTTATLEYGGKRFGYLHFTSFTMEAGKDLETAFAQFKSDGITDLVLDLRYNGGGYVITCQTLASMIAPPEVVKDKSVFLTEIYNDILTQSEESHTHFETEVTYKSLSGQEVTVHPLEVNPGIEHLWAIVTENSASAAESLICGLKPYMDVTLIGEQTSGKFTGGFLMTAIDWFNSIKETKLDIEEGKMAIPTWGMYVIASRYADCNGVTLSMPNGIAPDYESRDYAKEAIPLGDPSEKMLAATLSIATGGPAPASVKSVSAQEALPSPRRPGFGVLLSEDVVAH